VPQLHLYVSEAVAKQLRARARAAGLSVSRYLATVIGAYVGQGWPPRYFDHVVGRWQGRPLRRPSQGKLENRERSRIEA
jgi:hypothetical protein